MSLEADDAGTGGDDPTDVTNRTEGRVEPTSESTETYVITIQHPAHVHFFRHAIEELTEIGHEVHVFVRENEVAVDLLERYDLDYTVLAGEASGLASLAITQAAYEYRLFRAVRPLHPDVVAGIGGVAAAHVATLLGARGITFTDTEHAALVNGLAVPFADAVCTPDCFQAEVGDKQVAYPGYHELAYLHPERFEPDPSVLDAVHGDRTDPLVVVRLSAWDSSHDVGHGGFENVQAVVRHLENAGVRVALTSEVPLPEDLERTRLSLDPDRIHDLLYYADCYLGEGATMAAESAVLGTPAVYVNTLSMGYTSELESRFGLLYQFDGEDRHDRAIEKALALLDEQPADRFRQRRAELAREKVDVTKVVVDVLTGRTDRSWQD